jgi:RNA-dependent RNA polymerase
MRKEELGDQVMIEVRPSQVKFASEKYSLDVIRYASFSQGHLNRQVIILLSALQVPDEVFLKLMDNSVKRLNVKDTLDVLQ